jgi:hypothetical protein
MDKKSKIFFVVFFSIAFIVISISFYKFYVLKDYYIKSEVECDPETEKCFIYECDPTADSECPENPDERVSYYKLIEKKAYALPLCDSSSSDCLPIACQAGEDCSEFLCDETTKAKEEQCNDPEEYLKNNPMIEDSEENADSENSQEDAADESQAEENLEISN